MNEKVLLVFGDSIVATDVGNMLRAKNFIMCGSASQFSKAYALFRDTLPDLVIIDTSDKELEKVFEFVNTFREGHSFSVIFICPDNNVAQIKEFIRPNLDAFIVKPVSEYQLTFAATRLTVLRKRQENLKS